jgi:hypothetical protein
VAFADRIKLIERLEKLRGSSVLCFLTSLRPNVAAQMSEDAVRVFFDHLGLLAARPVEKLDLFLCSNGGSGTVPWRLVSLFREFARSFNVLLPYRAYSAATLLALGADEIVMHPFAELGPIDPTVANEFNPTDPAGRRLGISVEDVTAYVQFIKETVGITHEDELVQAIAILANKVHPLALGNVERFLAQSRMTAKKILRTHVQPPDEHAIDELVENLASKLYFHGHPINRREAKNELRLQVSADPSPELEALLWDLYEDCEKEFDNRSPFYPRAELLGQTASPTPPQKEYELLLALVESSRLSSRRTIRQRYSLIPAPPPAPPTLRGELLAEGWSHSPAP